MTAAVMRWRSWFRAAEADDVLARSREEDPLVVRLRAGDPDAVGEAYDRHHEKVRAFARRLVGDEAAADDLVQEVFVSLPQVAKRFRGDSALGTFLISIAINHARHHVRTAARRRAMVDRYAREPEPLTSSIGRDPEDAWAQRQLAAALSRAMDALPLDQRVAFVLCEVEERTSAEVARLLAVPEGTVRTRLFHARRKLREALEAEGVR